MSIALVSAVASRHAVRQWLFVPVPRSLAFASGVARLGRLRSNRRRVTS